MVNDTLAINERVSLITAIFSDRNEIEMDKHLSGDDAQTFVDKVYEVMVPSNSCHESIDYDSNLRISLIRYWITFLQRSAGGVCAIYANFAAAVRCFRGH